MMASRGREDRAEPRVRWANWSTCRGFFRQGLYRGFMIPKMDENWGYPVMTKRKAPVIYGEIHRDFMVCHSNFLVILW